RIYAASPWSRELRGYWPARPGRPRLLSGSCSSARSFAPRFLPTIGRPHAVALRFARCDQLTMGLAPIRVRPCWAHHKKKSGLSGSFFLLLSARTPLTIVAHILVGRRVVIRITLAAI